MSNATTLVTEVECDLSRDKELKNILSQINQDESVNLNKLKKFKLIIDNVDLKKLLAESTTLEWLEIVHEGLIEGLKELSFRIFEKFNFYPDTICDYLGVLKDGSGIQSENRKILKEALKLKIISLEDLFVATFQKLEEQQIINACLNLINEEEAELAHYN